VSISTNFTGLLFIVFLVLKLTHVIGWSWFWVTAPAWVPVLLVATVFLAIAVKAALK
jgi:hypothetical protein